MARRSSLPVASLLVGGLLGLAALPALGASAAPAASNAPLTDPNTELWLDEPLPPDVPEGRTVEVGYTVWDVSRQALSQVNSADIRVYPKAGKAAPTQGHTHADWPGHVIAPLTIPKGGLGRVEIGYPSQECHTDGTCVPVFVPFAFGGVGPPPDAPRSVLVIATIQPIAGPVSVDQAFEVDVDIAPKVAWDARLLALPKQVVLIASQLNGTSTTQVDMRVVNDGQYHASMTLSDGGDTVLTVAFQTGTELDPIDRSAQRIQVLGGDAPASPVASATPVGSAPSPVVPAGPDLPIVPIGLGAVLLIGGAYVIRRTFADL
jgi:hypothetical protein